MKDKKLIETLREDAEWAQANEWETPITLSDNLIDAADRLETLIAENEHLREATKMVPQWVSVEERLPEKWKDPDTSIFVNYLVYCRDYGVDIGNYHAKARLWLVMGLPARVTHWAPLPEPPSTEGSPTGQKG